MRAVRIHTQAGPGALVVEEAPYPHTAENDVVIRVSAAGFTPGELDWPSTWKDRAGRDRGPVIPGHEVCGEVAGLGTGARIIGTGRERDRTAVVEAGAERFAALDAEHFEEVAGQVDVVLDTVGGDVSRRSAAVVRPGGTLVSVTAPPKTWPTDCRAVFFVAETRDAFLRKRGIPGKTIIQVA